MSVRLLGFCQSGVATIHTAVYDLESFLWLLIWGIVHASKDIEGAKDANRGIQLMLEAWPGDANSNIAKLGHAFGWNDAVFGDIIRQWLGIFIRARQEIERFIKAMSSAARGNGKWDTACNELESCCKDIYKVVLESGFKYLNSVSQYPDWYSVVAANFDEVEGARGGKGE